LKKRPNPPGSGDGFPSEEKGTRGKVIDMMGLLKKNVQQIQPAPASKNENRRLPEDHERPGKRIKKDRND
jgi:hypothetical protein